MNNGRHDRALLLAILIALGGLYWQMFSMNRDMTDMRAELSANIADSSERLIRVELFLSRSCRVFPIRPSINRQRAESRNARCFREADLVPVDAIVTKLSIL